MWYSGSIGGVDNSTRSLGWGTSSKGRLHAMWESIVVFDVEWGRIALD